MLLKFKKLHPNAKVPQYGTCGAAAFDLFAVGSSLTADRVTVPTGLAFEIPEGFVMIIKPRSGLAFKTRVHAFSGTIDSDYRGEVKVLLMIETPGQFIKVKDGDAIAQAMLIPIPEVNFEEVAELSETQRGTGGFGSTG